MPTDLAVHAGLRGGGAGIGLGHCSHAAAFEFTAHGGRGEHLAGGCLYGLRAGRSVCRLRGGSFG